jgi:hypothetical protein
MKIKTDFTTNSSSSSFVVLSKKNLEIDSTELDKLFKDLVGTCKLFPNLAEDVGSAFKATMERVDLGELLDDCGYDTLENAEGYIFDDIKENSSFAFIYTGSFGNDGEALEGFLCDASIDYKDENIIISKDGGF